MWSQGACSFLCTSCGLALHLVLHRLQMHRGRCSTMQGPEAKSPWLESVRFSAVWNTGFRFPSCWPTGFKVTSIVIRIDLNWKSERLSQLDAIRAETELMLCIGTRWYKIDKLWRNAWDADSRNVPHVEKKRLPGELAPSSVGLVSQWKYKQWHRHRVS